jgi:hypothetical protein
MTPLFKKLNLAAAQPIHVLNAPKSFEKEVEAATKQLVRAAEGDAQLWMVYPKGSSKKYTCEFNRDTGWKALGDAGYEPVRQVAIDEDWSALRFRKAEFIKTMKRNPDGAISNAGRNKALKQGINEA